MLLVLVFLSGCVERVLHVKSDPPGALVYLNDQEAGRTPFTKEITWYGNYDVVVRAEGYETIKTLGVVNPPPWGWPPLDLICEILPFRFRDTPELNYTLKPAQPASAESLVKNAEELKKKMPEEK